METNYSPQYILINTDSQAKSVSSFKMTAVTTNRGKKRLPTREAAHMWSSKKKGVKIERDLITVVGTLGCLSWWTHRTLQRFMHICTSSIVCGDIVSVVTVNIYSVYLNIKSFVFAEPFSLISSTV